MDKDVYIACFERAIEEAMERDPWLTWDDAYRDDSVAARAMELVRENYSSLADDARDRAKYEPKP